MVFGRYLVMPSVSTCSHRTPKVLTPRVFRRQILAKPVMNLGNSQLGTYALNWVMLCYINCPIYNAFLLTHCSL